MKTLSRYSAAPLSLAILLASSPALVASRALAADDGDPQNTAQPFGALERGYRTGYSDGYQSGYRDSVEGRERDFQGKEDYQRADRVYLPAYGSHEDYRDGYQQGFESGYGAGFDRRGFDSAVPTTLRRRGATSAGDAAQTTSGGRPVIRRDDDDNNRDAARDADRTATPAASSSSSGALFDIPADTVLRVELLNNLSTDVSQRGDRFEARVVEPAQYADAVVTGRVTSVKRPGRIRGSGELQLSFQQIRLTDGRWANFNAQVTEVVETHTDTNVGDVDAEGGVKGRSTTKDDVTKVGAATGIGAIIGAIAGGGKGAAIGAVIGAGVGTGGVLTASGKDVRLPRGQHLMIRTSADTRIQ
ncbi:MAG TPA: hypothetical protein VM864_10840 [Pyrinomonadaceae bacterium]|nr:hypothetical protein [Pyrinomonadaceae bacterium]